MAAQTGRRRAGANGRAGPGRTRRLEVDTAEPLSGVIADAERRAQAEFEGTDPADTVLFFGRRYRIARKVGLMPLLKFAHAGVNEGADSSDLEGMAAMYLLLRGCFHRGTPACGQCATCQATKDGPLGPGASENCRAYERDEWPRFEQHAIDVCADDEDIFDVVNRVMEIVSARPTKRRSGSSLPAPSTSPNSKGRLSLPAGIPDPGDLEPVSEMARSRG